MYFKVFFFTAIVLYVES